MKSAKYILSFILPVIVLFILTIICGYYPFGDSSFVIFDGRYEYIPFLMHLGNALHLGKNLIYTLNGALGINFLGIWNLYLGSPLNLLVYFFNNQNIYMFFTLLVYIKIGFSGLSMYIFLNGLKTKYKGSIWNILFASIYALSGYAIAFNVHIMWLDAYIMLPLIIKYLDKLILEDKGTVYSLLLGITLIINYYMGFMLCIFVVMYFLYKSLLEKRFNKKTIINFILYSLLAGGIAGFVIVPNYYLLSTGRFNSLVFENLLRIDKYTLFSQFYNSLVGSFVIYDNYNYGSTTIYCTVFCIALLIHYFFNKSITLRRKLITGIFLLLFSLSFSFPLVDYAWTLFQQPAWWFHRYQFVYVFLLITIAYNSFVEQDKGVLSKRIRLTIFGLFILLGLFSFSYKHSGLKSNDYYVLFLFISFIFFILYMNFPNAKKLIVVLVLLEIGINSYVILAAHENPNYQEFITEYSNKANLIGSIPHDNYKIVDFAGIEDDGFLYNYSSLELFSSVYNDQVAHFYENVGLAAYNMNHLDIENYNPSILSLLGVKYFIGKNNYYDCNNDICINEYAMPNMFQVDDSILNVDLSKNVVENINRIYSSLMKQSINIMSTISKDNYKLNNINVTDDNLLKDINASSNIEIEYKAVDDELLFFNNRGLYDIAKSSINNNEINLWENPIIKLKKNDVIRIQFTELNNYVDEYARFSIFELYTMNIHNYEQSIQQLVTKTDFQYIDDNNYILKGNIKTQDGILFINVPYDDGIVITVDGRQTDYFPILSAFTGINIEEGEHEVMVSYRIKGLHEGIFLTIGSLITLIGSTIILKHKPY